MKVKVFLLISFLFTLTVTSQKTPPKKTENKTVSKKSTPQKITPKTKRVSKTRIQTNTIQTKEDKSIDGQFKSLSKKSSNYKEYKVILKSSYNQLQRNVLDSLKILKTEVANKKNEIKNQQLSATQLKEENTKIQIALDEVTKSKNSAYLFGIELSKNSYSMILFAVIILLTIGLTLFIYKFKNSNVLTVKAKSNLEDVENEFNLFRKKSLEREQKLRRQLQDEIIKNRNNS